MRLGAQGQPHPDPAQRGRSWTRRRRRRGVGAEQAKTARDRLGAAPWAIRARPRTRAAGSDARVGAGDGAWRPGLRLGMKPEAGALATRRPGCGSGAAGSEARDSASGLWRRSGAGKRREQPATPGRQARGRRPGARKGGAGRGAQAATGYDARRESLRPGPAEVTIRRRARGQGRRRRAGGHERSQWGAPEEPDAAGLEEAAWSRRGEAGGGTAGRAHGAGPRKGVERAVRGSLQTAHGRARGVGGRPTARFGVRRWWPGRARRPAGEDPGLNTAAGQHSTAAATWQAVEQWSWPEVAHGRRRSSWRPARAAGAWGKVLQGEVQPWQGVAREEASVCADGSGI